MKKAKIKNILIGSTIAAAGIAGAAAVSHAITEYLMRVALDRQAPKSMVKSQEKMMGEKQNRELAARIRNAAASLEERVTETAEITAEDGTRLVGHWWPCENPKRVVIAMHGWRSTWSQDFGIIADFWHNSGCSILFAEQRGQGNSGGFRVDGLYTEPLCSGLHLHSQGHTVDALGQSRIVVDLGSLCHLPTGKKLFQHQSGQAGSCGIQRSGIPGRPAA